MLPVPEESTAGETSAHLKELWISKWVKEINYSYTSQPLNDFLPSVNFSLNYDINPIFLQWSEMEVERWHAQLNLNSK